VAGRINNRPFGISIFTHGVFTLHYVRTPITTDLSYNWFNVNFELSFITGIPKELLQTFVVLQG
jgi:hypothetical protein